MPASNSLKTDESDKFADDEINTESAMTTLAWRPLAVERDAFLQKGGKNCC